MNLEPKRGEAGEEDSEEDDTQWNNIAKKTRRVKCAFLGPFHTVRPPKHTGA